MSTKIKMFAIAAAVALTAAVSASAPAFAWGGGAPDSSYDQAAHSRGFYDYYQGR